MLRRIVMAGLTAALVAPAFVIFPASAAVLFSCNSATGSATLSPGLVHDKRPQSLSIGPTAPAGPADLALATTSDAGVKANGASVEASLSADGTKVAFRSVATNLDPGDTDSRRDIYVKDPSPPATSSSPPPPTPGSRGTTTATFRRSRVTVSASRSSPRPPTWNRATAAARAPQATQANSGSGFTKTKLKGRLDWSALDSFNCSSGTADPISWLDLVNNGSWIVKNA